MVDYDAVVIRLVPRVHVPSGEAIGVALHARRAGFLGLAWVADSESVAARWGCDAGLLARYQRGLQLVCEGGAGGGPIGRLPPSERFHWLAATRSTVLQPGHVHTGRCAHPGEALARIASSLDPEKR